MPDIPFVGDIYAFAFSFAPRGWAQCNGQSLPINQNQALFSILGTTYGGNGVTTFNLPNLMGRVPIGFGSYGGNSYIIGQSAGEQSHALTVNEMPTHNHVLRADATTAAASNSGTPANGNAIGQSAGTNSAINMYSTAAPGAFLAPQTIQNQGGGQAHENRQPFLVLNYCIALQGAFPSRG